MKKKFMITAAVLVLLFALLLCACSMNDLQSGVAGTAASETSDASVSPAPADSTVSDTYAGTAVFSASGASASGLATAEGSTVIIQSAGTYLISGSCESGQIIVDADKDSKITLVLSDLNLSSSDGPAIWAKGGDLTIVLSGTNTLEDSLTYTLEAGTDEPNACIYSKDDLTITGAGSLNVIGNYYIGIESKDDLIIESGSITVSASDDALRGHDSVTVVGGDLDLSSGADGIKSNNESDTEKGTVTISGGTVTIRCSDDGIDAVNDILISAGSIAINSEDDAIHSDTSISITGGDMAIDAGDDAIHAEYMLQITGGTLDISAHEALEACLITIDDGKITISASDDAINATASWGTTVPCLTINGGELDITVSQGDTDALDSNGNLYINGGTLSINAQSPFDYDGEGQLSGGTVIVNGTQITQLSSQMMGGPGGFGGMNGQMPSGSQGFGSGSQTGPGGFPAGNAFG